MLWPRCQPGVDGAGDGHQLTWVSLLSVRRWEAGEEEGMGGGGGRKEQRVN